MREAICEFTKEEELGVGLVSRDAGAARRFYCDVMGFEEIDATPLEMGASAGSHTNANATTWNLRAGGSPLEILELPEPPERAPTGMYDRVGIRVIAIFIDDLDAVTERIRGAGRRVAAATDLPGNLRIAFAKDTDGNMLELIGLPEPAGSKLSNRLQIGLTVRDIERSRRFYGEVLGFPAHPTLPMPEGLTRHAFGAGRSTVKFWSPQPVPEACTGAPEHAVGLRYLRLRVANADREGSLEAACAALEARGVRVHRPERCESVSECALPWSFVRDPDDNWLRLVGR